MDEVFDASTAMPRASRARRGRAPRSSARDPRGRPRPRARSRRRRRHPWRVEKAASHSSERARGRAALDRAGDALADAFGGGIRCGLVALDDDDLGARRAGTRARCRLPCGPRRARRRGCGARSSASPASRGTRSCGAASRGSRTARPAARRRSPDARRAGRAARVLVCCVASGIVRRDAVGDRVGGGEQLVRRVHARDQSRGQGFVGVEDRGRSAGARSLAPRPRSRAAARSLPRRR